jgi:hypothetical protein
MTERFFVAVEPLERKAGSQDMAQGTVKDNARDELDEAGATEKTARRQPPRK